MVDRFCCNNAQIGNKNDVNFDISYHNISNSKLWYLAYIPLSNQKFQIIQYPSLPTIKLSGVCTLVAEKWLLTYTQRKIERNSRTIEHLGILQKPLQVVAVNKIKQHVHRLFCPNCLQFMMTIMEIRKFPKYLFSTILWAQVIFVRHDTGKC